MNRRSEPVTASEEKARFAALKEVLPRIWHNLNADPGFKHTSVIVPSLSVDQEELSKVLGASFYEERLLFALIRLRNPNARLIYLTSQPVHEDIVEYYLQLLEGLPMRHARERLFLLSAHDASNRPLTEKLLERPRLLNRLQDLIGDRSRAYLTCYNATALERRLSVLLGIPLNGLDPDLLSLGSKTGNRRVFAEAGVNHPRGFEDLHSEDDIVGALQALAREKPELRRAVVKLNEGFSGEGNALFRFPERRQDPEALRAALAELACTSSTQGGSALLHKFTQMGGVVEEMVEAEEVHSPSVQMRIQPDGEPILVSSHEQILGGATGQSYLGCSFPACDDYRGLIQGEALKIGAVLGREGVIGRFAVDFLVSRAGGGDWIAHAIEINLRMGGTTPPYHALEFLVGGQLEPASGLFRTAGGQPKYYIATDNLKSSAYRGLLPEDLLEIGFRHGIGFRQGTGTGTLFFMMGALSQYGKVGMTCIGNSPEEAQALFDQARKILDREADFDGRGELAPLADRHFAME